MTQAERLIRNLCEERRLALLEGEREAIKVVPEKHTWRELPLRVRELVYEKRRLERRIEKIKKDISARGYHADYHMQPKRPLSLKNHTERQTTVRQQYASRQARVTALRTTAVIASLGKSATEAGAILKQLQKDLAKV